MHKPKSAARDGFGIINPYGDMWTTEIFDTEEQAHQHVRDFWRGTSQAESFKYTVVRARQRTSSLNRGEATMRDLDGLIEKIEGLEGPNYAIDVAIAQALVPEIIVGRQRQDDSGFDPHTYRSFTANIDDVAWLVGACLPGWACGFDSGPKTHIAFVDPHDYADRFLAARYTAEAETSALALLRALLRALQSQEKQ